MIRDAMKILALVNGSIALAFAIFIEMTKLCNQIGISPWWTAVVYVGGFAAWWRNQCKGAQRV
jgi:hypothetical protein